MKFVKELMKKSIKLSLFMSFVSLLVLFILTAIAWPMMLGVAIFDSIGIDQIMIIIVSNLVWVFSFCYFCKEK